MYGVNIPAVVAAFDSININCPTDIGDVTVPYKQMLQYTSYETKGVQEEIESRTFAIKARPELTPVISSSRTFTATGPLLLSLQVSSWSLIRERYYSYFSPAPLAWIYFGNISYHFTNIGLHIYSCILPSEASLAFWPHP